MDGYVRGCAADALGKVGTEKAIDALIAVLEDKDMVKYFRGRAAEALGKIGTEKAIDALIAVLKDKDTDRYLRKDAASALGEIGTEKAIDPLIAVLEDEGMDRDVRGDAADALCEIFKKLKEVKQENLFNRIYSLKFDNELKNSLINKIKNVTARRFIKITFQNKNQYFS